MHRVLVIGTGVGVLILAACVGGTYVAVFGVVLIAAGLAMNPTRPVAVQMERGQWRPGPFRVILSAPGDRKIHLTRALRQLLPLGLKEAKDIVDAAPSTLAEGISEGDAHRIKEWLEKEGAVVLVLSASGKVHDALDDDASADTALTYSPGKSRDHAASETGLYQVTLVYAGDRRIEIAQAVSEALGVKLTEAKQAVDRAPVVLASGVSKEFAWRVRQTLERQGAKVTLSSVEPDPVRIRRKTKARTEKQ